MNDWLLSKFDSSFAIAISSICFYIVLILLTRIFGKRSFSKMTSFDFVITIAIGSIIACALLSSSVSFVEGFIGLLSGYVLQTTVAFIRRFTPIKKLLDNSPRSLMDCEEILRSNLKRAHVIEENLRAKLHEANFNELKDFRAIVLKAIGDIAVLHAAESDKQLEFWLLEGVEI